MRKRTHFSFFATRPQSFMQSLPAFKIFLSRQFFFWLLAPKRPLFFLVKKTNLEIMSHHKHATERILSDNESLEEDTEDNEVRSHAQTTSGLPSFIDESSEPSSSESASDTEDVDEDLDENIDENENILPVDGDDIKELELSQDEKDIKLNESEQTSEEETKSEMELQNYKKSPIPKSYSSKSPQKLEKTPTPSKKPKFVQHSFLFFFHKPKTDIFLKKKQRNSNKK